jgi:hypothetical protein
MDDVRLYKAALKDSDVAIISSPAGEAPFEISKIVRAPDGSAVTLTFRSRPGRIYAVDFCTDLTAAPGQPGSWVELTDFVPATGAETIFEDGVAANLARAFYRIRDVTP